MTQWSDLPERAAVSVGAVAAELLRANEFLDVSGSVVGTFSSGCYVRFDQDVIAVGAIPPGPLHVVLKHPPDVHDRDTCAIGADRITIAGRSVNLSRTPRWDPALPDRFQLAEFAANIVRLDSELTAVSDLSSVWTKVAAAAAVGDVELAIHLLQGRGTGLTPAGDDVIAGLMLFDAWMNPGPVDEELRIAHINTIRSTALSRSFLTWAAKGQSIEPVHHLTEQAALSDDDCFRKAALVVSQIGGSSGHALLAGLQLAARPSLDGRRAPRSVG